VPVPKRCKWLRESLGAGGSILLSPLRNLWLALGLVCLLSLVALRRGVAVVIEQHAEGRAVAFAVRAFLLASLWAAALTIVPGLARLLSFMPGQEGRTFAAYLAAPAMVLGGALIVCATGRALGREQGGLLPDTGPDRFLATARFRSWLRCGAQGWAAGVVIIAALHVLAAHFHATPLAMTRLALGVWYAVLSLPAFLLLDRWLRWVAPGAGSLPVLLTGALLAVLTAVTAPLLVERMALAPAYLFSIVLLFFAAYRAGLPAPQLLAGSVTAAVLMGWIAGQVCALY
jgi:hypothetical protein